MCKSEKIENFRNASGSILKHCQTVTKFEILEMDSSNVLSFWRTKQNISKIRKNENFGNASGSILKHFFESERALIDVLCASSLIQNGRMGQKTKNVQK